MQALFCSRILQAPIIQPGSNGASKASLFFPGSMEQQQVGLGLSQQVSHSHSHSHSSGIEVSTQNEAPFPETIGTQRLTDFALISISLLLVFWLGNYVIPDLIFSRMFQPEKNEDDQDEIMEEKERILNGLLGNIDADKDLLSSPKKTVISRGGGFGHKSTK